LLSIIKLSQKIYSQLNDSSITERLDKIERIIMESQQSIGTIKLMTILFGGAAIFIIGLVAFMVLR